MNNPQGPGKQGRKDANKARGAHSHQAGAPGRSEHQQSGQSARPSHERPSHERPSHEQGHMQNRPGSSHHSTSHSSQSHDRESMDEE
jgi:hypothetical protein